MQRLMLAVVLFCHDTSLVREDQAAWPEAIATIHLGRQRR